MYDSHCHWQDFLNKILTWLTCYLFEDDFKKSEIGPTGTICTTVLTAGRALQLPHQGVPLLRKWEALKTMGFRPLSRAESPPEDIRLRCLGLREREQREH